MKRIEVSAEDQVNHPPHYTWHPAGIEAVTVCEAFTYNIGSAIAYLWRCGRKGDGVADYIRDLEKARWYVEREIERIKGGKSQD
jgi:hypothetical protein